MKKKSSKLEENDIPVLGQKYHFWDDGKVSQSRHYVAIVTGIFTHKEMTKDFLNVYKRWKEEIKEHDWLINPETDYFVRCDIKEYDEYPIWFVRTKTNGWFSLNVENCWQGGTLDVDKSIFKDYVYSWDILYTDEFDFDTYIYTKG